MQLQPLYSIVIPTLNEKEHIQRCLRSALAIPDAEIIVADGGSDDATPALVHALQEHNPTLHLIESRRGRGIQLREGASRARGDILLFIHADCVLPSTAADLLEEFRHQSLPAATFRLKFDAAGFLLRFYEYGARIDSPLTRFGDQGLVIRRRLYDECSGFAELPLFEDVDLFARIRRRGRLGYLEGRITCSARRFEEHGPLRQMLRNAILYLGYRLGISPARLAEHYKRVR